MQAKPKTVVVGMSGGVDSSVAALLLKKQGLQVIGLFMKNWEESSPQSLKNCTAAEDYRDVAHTCSLLDIPFHAIDFVKEYRNQVFDEFLEGLKSGLTPNPDILCNREIKFKSFFNEAMKLGADALATGHYCQIIDGKLAKAADTTKDQTYFLHAIDPKVFPRVLFPLGHLRKDEVRQIAQEHGLPTAKKKDSTGICFIGERNFPAFISNYLKPKVGHFKTLTGVSVGEHNGAHFYTLGQRRHLGLGGAGDRWFVIKKDMEQNIVYVERGEHEALFSKTLVASKIHWLQPEMSLPLRSFAKIRYRQKEQPCLIESLDVSHIKVTFETPQRAITPGQSVVFYDENFCLGGSLISTGSFEV